ncbi:hypothetical protein GDO81_024362 [Engystomops pustulosus]|uniref:Ragulator complex protein LAMTOR1 n=1 Tax=Engystomops pustulosus TaxID=76066 RepID=A0AAV6ZAM9_ENGPU|nr:hypothetical protein GDO81_024362 [Engystomops pustulosus]
MGLAPSGDRRTTGERQHLLPPNETPSQQGRQNGSNRTVEKPVCRTDEQALLFASSYRNIIDVSAVESQGMEQHECMDRARQYSTKLAKMSGNLTHGGGAPSALAHCQPHQISPATQSYADIAEVMRTAQSAAPTTILVSKIAAYAFSALSQIRVDAKEDLVVQFGIP